MVLLFQNKDTDSYVVYARGSIEGGKKLFLSTNDLYGTVRYNRSTGIIILCWRYHRIKLLSKSATRKRERASMYGKSSLTCTYVGTYIRI